MMGTKFKPSLEKLKKVFYTAAMFSVKTISAAGQEELDSTFAQGGEKPFVLAHLSDPHLTSLADIRLRELLNKRLFGYWSWYRRRRHVHRPQVLEALLRDLALTNPDHVAVTGDLTHLGLPAEFRQASRWLTELGPPDKVTVVPGNHEAYAFSARHETLDLWTPYLTGDEVSPESIFPSLRVRGPLALIGLSSARPCAPFLAIGSLGREQLTRFEKILEQTGQRGLLRIVLLHHAPVSGSITWRKRLTDAPLFAEIVARQGAELVLHGHAHVPLSRHLVAGRRNIPVLGVPSASDHGSRPQRTARYHLYRFAPRSGGWQLKLVVRVYAPGSQEFVTDEEKELFLPVAKN